jgi:ribosome recycling factor
MNENSVLETVKTNMDKTLQIFYEEISVLKGSRVSPLFIDKQQFISSTGKQMLISHAANVYSSGQMIMIEPFYDEEKKFILKSLSSSRVFSELGLYPTSVENGIKIPLPSITGESIQKLGKLAEDVGEKMKIALRDIRRKSIKDLEKLKLSKNEEKVALKKLEETVTTYMNKVETEVNKKKLEFKRS